jgi:hypothetical protein
VKVLLLLILVLIAESFASPVAVINERVISREEFNLVFELYWKEILHLSPKRPTIKDKELFLLEYIKGMILEDVAREMGIRVSEEEISERLRFWGRNPNANPLIRDFVKREILVKEVAELVTTGIYVSEGEVKAYYLLNKREFYYPKQVKLLRIVVDSKKIAERVRRKLRKGVIPSGKGILVGKERWYSLQSLPKRVRAKLYPYKKGRVTVPIRFDGKYVVLKIVDVRESGILPLSFVREEVKARILRDKKEEVFRKWFQEVLKSYRLELYPENL